MWPLLHLRQNTENYFPLFTLREFSGKISTNPKKYHENLQSHFLGNRNFNFFFSELPFILRADRKRKKKKAPRNICKRTLDKGFERDWSFGLGAMLGDGHTEN